MSQRRSPVSPLGNFSCLILSLLQPYDILGINHISEKQSNCSLSIIERFPNILVWWFLDLLGYWPQDPHYGYNPMHCKGQQVFCEDPATLLAGFYGSPFGNHWTLILWHEDKLFYYQFILFLTVVKCIPWVVIVMLDSTVFISI